MWLFAGWPGILSNIATSETLVSYWLDTETLVLFTTLDITIVIVLGVNRLVTQVIGQLGFRHSRSLILWFLGSRKSQSLQYISFISYQEMHLKNSKDTKDHTCTLQQVNRLMSLHGGRNWGKMCWLVYAEAISLPYHTPIKENGFMHLHDHMHCQLIMHNLVATRM